MLKDPELAATEKLAGALRMDSILSLGLKNISIDTDEDEIPQEILDLVEERRIAKVQKNYARADQLRAIVEKAGYQLKDTPENSIVVRICNQMHK
jgi:cysteinyl-tRNA synthetase